MDNVLDHIEDGIDSFEMAKEVAPLGTRLMIEEVLGDARRLHDRVDRILDNDD